MALYDGQAYVEVCLANASRATLAAARRAEYWRDDGYAADLHAVADHLRKILEELAGSRPRQ